MNRSIRVSLLLAALAAPAALSAQAGSPGERGPRDRAAGEARSGPVERLLAHRSELSLTAEQVARLEAVETGLEERNRPLREQLRASRPARGQRPRDLSAEQREELRERMRERRPLMEKLRENGRAAMQEVREVLTDEQERKARELIRADRAEARRDRPRGRRAPRGQPGPRRR